MHKCLAYTPYYIQHKKKKKKKNYIQHSEYEPGQKTKQLALQLVLLKSTSSDYSRQLG